MRRYEGMRLPPAVDKALRKELLKPDRYLKQLQAGLSKVLTKTNFPSVIVSTGSGAPGSPGNLPMHNHSSVSQGGPFLGISGGTITGHGYWNFSDGIGVGTVNTTKIFVNVSKVYDAATSDVQGLVTSIRLTNFDPATGGQLVAPHQLSSEIQLTGNGNLPGEIRNLFNNLKISNTVDDGSPGTIWTNVGYRTQINTAKNIYQMIGNRVSFQTLANAGNITKIEAYVMDNSLFLATGKSISEFFVFSCPTPKVFSGNGIGTFAALKVDAIGTACTNSYVVKADAPVGTITNKWGLHISGSTVKSYHEGKFGINNTGPSAMLDVLANGSSVVPISAVGASAQSADWISMVNNAGNSVGLKVANTGLTTHSYVLPTAQGASGYALTNDGSGNLSWAPAAPGNRTRQFFLNPGDFQQSNGTVAPTGYKSTSAHPKAYQEFVMVDAPAAGPQAFTTQFVVPQDYVSGTAMEVWLHWSMTVANLADKTWVFEYHHIVRGNKENIDGTWTSAADTLVDNGLTGSGGDYDVGVADYHAVTRIATDLPSTGLSAGKMVVMTIDRLTTDANDNLDKNIAFMGLELRYTAIL